jgi:hypothetical protein
LIQDSSSIAIGSTLEKIETAVADTLYTAKEYIKEGFEAVAEGIDAVKESIINLTTTSETSE